MLWQKNQPTNCLLASHHWLHSLVSWFTSGMFLKGTVDTNAKSSRPLLFVAVIHGEVTEDYIQEIRLDSKPLWHQVNNAQAGEDGKPVTKVGMSHSSWLEDKVKWSWFYGKFRDERARCSKRRSTKRQWVRETVGNGAQNFYVNRSIVLAWQTNGQSYWSVRGRFTAHEWVRTVARNRLSGNSIDTIRAVLKDIKLCISFGWP